MFSFDTGGAGWRTARYGGKVDPRVPRIHPNTSSPMAQPFCTDCQRRMEGGYLLDNAQSTQEALSWVEGPPEKSFWGSMKTKGRRKLTVYAWRCPGCAQVRLFAPE
jgi:hypothetical protein